MKVEIISKEQIHVYITKHYIDKLNYKVEEDIFKIVKEVILRLKKYHSLFLFGFYEVVLRIIPNVGIDLLFEKEDSCDLVKDIIDVKISINKRNSSYFQAEDIEIIKEYSPIYYLQGNYYLSCNKIKEKDTMKCSEFCTIYFDDENKIMKEGIKVK